jgi:O-antigen ligase|tara:strand:+ start:522 stop:1691 length:1170 start_codon:yes stop_codon:yes gene_type:complete
MKWFMGLALVLGLVLPGSGSGAGTWLPRWLAIDAMAILAAVSFIGHRVRLSGSDMFVLLLLAWSAITLLWSPDAAFGSISVWHSAAIAAVFLYARHSEFDFRPWVVLAIVVACFFFFAGNKANMAGFGNRTFLAEFLVLGSAVAIGWTHEHYPRLIITIPLLMVAFIVLLSVSSRLPWAAVAVLGWMLAGEAMGGRPWRVFAWGVAIGINVLVFSFDHWDGSVWSRLELWYNTGAMILQAPWFGHGMGSFDYVYDGYRAAHVGVLDWSSSVVANPSDFPATPHNEILSLWSRTGLIGLTIGVCLFVRALSYSRGADRALLIMAAVLSMISFPMETAPTSLLIAMVAGRALRDEPLELELPALLFRWPWAPPFRMRFPIERGNHSSGRAR